MRINFFRDEADSPRGSANNPARPIQPNSSSSKPASKALSILHASSLIQELRAALESDSLRSFTRITTKIEENSKLIADKDLVELSKYCFKLLSAPDLLHQASSNFEARAIFGILYNIFKIFTKRYAEDTLNPTIRGGLKSYFDTIAVASESFHMRSEEGSLQIILEDLAKSISVIIQEAGEHGDIELIESLASCTVKKNEADFPVQIFSLDTTINDAANFIPEEIADYIEDRMLIALQTIKDNAVSS